MTTLLPTSNPISTGLYCLERMLACSPTFQGLVGTTVGVTTEDVLAAKAFVDYKEAEGTEPLPRACISLVNPCQWGVIAGGFDNFMRPHGEVWCYVAATTPSEYVSDMKSATMWAANLFGSIQQDVAALAGLDQTFDTDVPQSHLALLNWDLLDFAETPEEEWSVIGRFWWGIFSAKWGDDA